MIRNPELFFQEEDQLKEDSFDFSLTEDLFYEVDPAISFMETREMMGEYFDHHPFCKPSGFHET